MTSLAFFFSENDALIEADLSELKADKIISLKGLFIRCKNLKKVKFEFTDANKIVDLSSLFNGCFSLNSAIFNFNAEKVIDMSEMFKSCYSLNSL